MELEVDKKYSNVKPSINRVELEYEDMNYVIVNFEEKVIDINGDIYEYTINEKQLNDLEKMIWNYENIDEYDYWPDKSKDHPPMAIKWRIAWWDGNQCYHHKSGVTKYPDDFMDLVKRFKELKK